MTTFPIKGDEIPEGYKGWMLLLDELTHAPISVQKAAFKVILDRKVGEHDLHEKVVVVAAGNTTIDDDTANEITVALQSRMIHISVHVDNDIWGDWAAANQIDHRITSYVKFMPQNLHKFDSQHMDVTYPTPRTWYFANKLIKDVEKLTSLDRKLLAGTVSEGVAGEFVQFAAIYEDMVTIEDILKNPEKTKVPDEPGTKYALTGAIAHHMTTQNIDSLFTYLCRFDPEFQIICIRDVIKRKGVEMVHHPIIKKWTQDNAYLLQD